MLGSATPDGLRAALASGNPYSWAHQVPPRDLVPATIATQAALYSMGAAATLQAFGSYMPSVEGRCVVLLGPARQTMLPEQPGADRRQEAEPAHETDHPAISFSRRNIARGPAGATENRYGGMPRG